MRPRNSWWRLRAAFLLCAGTLAACGGGSSAPSPVTSIASTSTTSIAATQQSRHYQGTYQPSPSSPALPLDLSLFFTVPGGAVVALDFSPRAIFNVTGGYNTGPNGFTGSITGTLDGTLENGLFTGVMTANLANGCVARRNYSGLLTAQQLNWTPGAQLETCGGNTPLNASVTPAVISTPATTSIAATTTVPQSSTTTTSVGTSSTTTTQPTTTTTQPTTTTTTTIPGGPGTTTSTTSISTTSSSTTTSTSTSTTSVSTTTTSVASFSVSLVLNGDSAYSVSSPQLGTTCTHPNSSGTVTCSYNAFGTIQLISNVLASDASGCDSVSNGTNSTTCTLMMNSPKKVSFSFFQFLK